MKQNKVKIYATALAEILAEQPASAKASAWQGKVVANFVKLLIAEGLEKKSKEILEMAEEMVLAKNGNKKITFETARKITASQKKLLESIAKNGDLIKEKINPELIAGVKIILNNEKQFDNSMQSKLNNIF
jgi:F0F1-type ATP synthase delta subunit